MDRGLYLSDSSGNPLSEQAPGLQAPGFHFTAYLQWTGFENVDEVDLAMSNLGSGERHRLIGAAKDAMRARFTERLTEQMREQVNRWTKSAPTRATASFGHIMDTRSIRVWASNRGPK